MLRFGDRWRNGGVNDCADVLGERQCELCNDIADSWDSSSDPSVLTAEKVSAI